VVLSQGVSTQWGSSLLSGKHPMCLPSSAGWPVLSISLTMEGQPGAAIKTNNLIAKTLPLDQSAMIGMDSSPCASPGPSCSPGIVPGVILSNQVVCLTRTPTIRGVHNSVATVKDLVDN